MAVVKEEGREKIMPDSMRSRRIRLYLIRHGQVVGHEEPRFNGHINVDVTPWGRAQLERLAQHLAGEEIHGIYCSDLKRTLSGARIMAQGRGLEPVPLKELREMNLGVLEGLTYRQVKEKYPEVFREWRRDLLHYRLPQGECFLDLYRRVSSALDRIMEGKQGRNLLMVAHGGVNRAILVRALNMKLEDAFRIEQDYGCLNVIDYYPDWTVVKLVNMSF